MNNLEKRRQTLGEWVADQGIEAEKALLWPVKSRFATSLLEDAEVERVIGLSPHKKYGKNVLPSNVQVENTYTHNYTDGEFDLEYGWAIAYDISKSLEHQIEPEANLHQYEYSDKEERDIALDNAFDRITETSDRLLGEENSTAIYNLDYVRSPQLPRLDEDLRQNQREYAARIAGKLEENRFSTELIETPEFSNDIHVLGSR